MMFVPHPKMTRPVRVQIIYLGNGQPWRLRYRVWISVPDAGPHIVSRHHDYDTALIAARELAENLKVYPNAVAAIRKSYGPGWAGTWVSGTTKGANYDDVVPQKPLGIVHVTELTDDHAMAVVEGV